jgi:hypothetical protein
MKELVIKCTKAVLVLTEQELMNALPQELLIKALRRGKSYKRAERVKRYEQSKEKLGVVDNG